MPFKHSCFISYAHGNGSGQTLEQFVNELKRAIDDSVDSYYLDEAAFLDKDRLRGGQFWNEALARAICESLCMIVVYTPKYERHLYCRREYAAMERLEEQRLALIRSAVAPHGLIIPVIFKGNMKDLPDKISGRQGLDFTRYNGASIEIRRNPEFLGMIQQIADTIDRLYQAFNELTEDPYRDCGGFLIPGKDEVEPWRPSKIPPFPGRSEGS